MDTEGDGEWQGPGSCGEWQKSSWRQVTSVMPQESVLWPAPINIFVNDLDGGTGHTLIKFVNDKKL